MNRPIPPCPSPPARPSHWLAPLHLVVIALLALLAYSNTFDASFHFDDTRNIVANSLIRDFSCFLDLSKARRHPYYNDFKMRPIGFLTFALNYRLHGLRVTGFHVLNLFIHVANGVLVYLLTLLTFRTPQMSGGGATMDRRRLIALFAGLLFVVHPLQTQAVTYIVQRFASLATTFYLATLLAYAGSRLLHRQGRHPGGGALYLVALVSTILAMKTKELSFTIPLMIALYEWMFFSGTGEGPGRRFVLLIPFALTLPLIPLSAIDIAQQGGPVAERLAEQSRVLTAMPRTDYLLTQMTVIPVYLRLIFLPIGQNLDHDHPLYSTILDGRVLLSGLLLLGLFLVGVGSLSRSRAGDRRWRLVAFGIFWCYLALLTESSVIPVVDVLFEHRMYLPSFGVFLALSAGLFICEGSLWPRHARGLGMALLLGGGVVLALAGATYARNRVWRDETTLWEDVARKSPNKARVRNTLGAIYLDTNRLDLAQEEFQRTLALDSNYWAAQVNLGTYYLMKAKEMDRQTGSAGQAYELTQQALTSFSQAQAKAPTNPTIGSLIDSVRRMQQELLGEMRALNPGTVKRMPSSSP